MSCVITIVTDSTVQKLAVMKAIQQMAQTLGVTDGDEDIAVVLLAASARLQALSSGESS